MTANGVSTTDPVAGQALVTVNIIHHGDTAAMLDAKQAAFTKCKQYLPASWPLKVDAAEIARTRGFVACVRKHGVDWPETDANGMADWPTDPLAMATPAYNAAIRACRGLLDGPRQPTPGEPMRRTLAVVGATLALAGCTSQPATPHVATAQSPSAAAPGAAAPSASPSPPETDYDKAVRYTRCMTENGTPMSDPVIGKPIQISAPIKGTGWSQKAPSFDKCKQFLPTTWPVKVDPAEIAKTRPFAECMRKRGISWPEPDANGMVAYPSDPDVQSTPAYTAAEKACRYLYDDPANNLPENQ
jgi:hypothetical protein